MFKSKFGELCGPLARITHEHDDFKVSSRCKSVLDLSAHIALRYINHLQARTVEKWPQAMKYAVEEEVEIVRKLKEAHELLESEKEEVRAMLMYNHDHGTPSSTDV